ncbi:MAG: protein kinase [Pyrinomonadaceae bacterium]
MTPENWKKVKSIVEIAVELAPDDRAAFLDQKCADDMTLRNEVESLLAADNTNAQLLEGNFSVAVLGEGGPDPRIGTKIGHYEITAEIGAGGMGAVYLAERSDGAFEQKVALKLIKRGMDSDAILRHFVNERQILASLEHPNIAHLIDGGTTKDDLPFFVMEYVEGETIVDYATNNGLSLEARLELFRKVCSAVSYAHQNLVIHRDLKPSNILVTKDGTPKLLDFGIAKLLKGEPSQEQSTRNFIFTPEYASPEQVRGENLTTATDVYSLGVILYELLTGDRPYDTRDKSIGDVIRSICETEPERPSSVVSRPQPEHGDTGQNEKQTQPRSKPQALRGDLDNIILKALRKEPERRYTSVEQFSEDIRLHLAGLPVLAIKDTWTYRATKFIKRNRAVAAAAAIILVTIIGGLSATLYQARIAQKERLKAEQRFNDVRALANSFLFEFHDAIQPLSGSTPARKLVVSRAIEYLDKLAVEAGDDAALQRELATAYERIGKIQGNSYFSNLGETDAAMASYRRSLEIRQRLADLDPVNRGLQYDLAISHRGVGDMYYTMDDLTNALQSYQSSHAILEKVAADDPSNLKYLSSLADVISRLGDIKGMPGYSNLGDQNGAMESYQRVVALAEKLTNAAPENQEYRGDYATRLFYFGKLQAASGDVKGAIISGRKGIALLEALVVANPNDAAYESRLMVALNSLRSSLLADGQTAEAIENARRVITTMERLVSADPKNSNLKRGLGTSYHSLGICQVKAKQVGEGMESFRRALTIAEELAAAEPKNAEHRSDVESAKKSLTEAKSAR